MSNFQYRILVVAQEAASKQVLQESLQNEEFEVEMVASAEKGLKKVTSEHYDLIISEVTLATGKMSGLDLLGKVRESNTSVPFIIISDEASVENSVKAINYGVSGYLEKPVSLEDARTTIERAIRHYKSRFLKNELENYTMDNAYNAVITSSEQSILKLIETVDNLIELLYPEEYGSFPDLKMAIYECLGNAVEHGNKGNDSKNIYFRIELKMDRIMCILRTREVVLMPLVLCVNGERRE